MALAILGIVLTLLLFGGIGFAVYYQIQKTDPKNQDASIKNNVESAQEFLPFKDIKDGVIDLGGHRYRLIIQCNSVNYHLKTPKEQDIIEMSFHRFLNSLTFPITFFIHSKVFNFEEMIKSLKEDLEKTVKNYPQLTDVAEMYYQEILNISERLNNNKEKRKYVIVGYDDAINLGKLSDDEKFEHAKKELYKRALIIKEGLNGVGLKSQILNHEQVIEVAYSVFHRDNHKDYMQIANGEYMEDIIMKDSPELKQFAEERLSAIVRECCLRLEELAKNAPEYSKETIEKTLEEIEKIKKQYANYYEKESDVNERT